MKNGLKIGIMGLVDENYFDTLGDQSSVYLIDPIQIGKKYLKYFKTKKCDLIICLTHMLNKSDKILAEELEGVDLFLGGHEHGYMIYKNEQRISVKSGPNFESFNEIILEFSSKKIK